MLILTRKPGESVYIGDDIKITIVEIKGHQIRVGIDAPRDFRIYREEIYLQIMEENKLAAQESSIDELGALERWNPEGSKTAPRKSAGLSGIKAQPVKKKDAVQEEKRITETEGSPVIVRKRSSQEKDD